MPSISRQQLKTILDRATYRGTGAVICDVRHESDAPMTERIHLTDTVSAWSLPFSWGGVNRTPEQYGRTKGA